MKSYPSALIVLICSSLMAPATTPAQTYQSYNDLAKEAFDKKNYELTIEYCNKSIAVVPNGWAYWERAAAYYNLYKYEQAIENYGNAIPYYTDNSSLAKLYFYRGECRYFAARYKDALEDFNKASGYGYADYKYLYWYRGHAWYYSGEYRKAETDYGMAMPYYKESPKDHAKLYAFRADARYRLKNTNEALEDYTRAIEINPGYCYAYEKRSDILAAKKQYEKAKEDIDKAIKYQDDDALGKMFLYLLWQKKSLYNYYTGNYEEGIQDALEALKKDSSMTTWWRLGLNYYGAGAPAKAIEAYRKALAKTEESSSKAILYRNISLCSKKNTDYRTALKDVNTALGYDKAYGDAYWTRAEIYASIKKYPEALADYDEAIRLFANNNSTLASLYQDRAEISCKTKDYDRAMYDFNKSLALAPNNTSYLYNTGRFLIESKKSPLEGKERLEKCIALDKDTSSNYSYAKFFLGDTDAALHNMFRLLDKYRLHKDRHPWNLHIIGCIYALSGNTRKALEYVDKSLQAGFDDYHHLVNDRDLVSIMNLPEYKAILAKYKVPAPKW